MNIRVLKYFVTIVETQNISRAAKILHITQPTLSRQIKELEEELGTSLFSRGSRRIQVTDDGHYLYNRAIDILNLVNKTESNLKRSEHVSGDLYIGAAESQSLDVLARAIKDLLAAHPHINCHFYSGNADDLLERLNHGLLDFAVTIGPFDHKKYDSLALKNRDRWGVLVPKGHPLTQKAHIELADTFAYPLILSAQTSQSPFTLGDDAPIKVVATYTLLYNASTLVKEGVGIAICLDGIVQTDFEASPLTFLPFEQENTDSLQILWKKEGVQSNLARHFLASLKNRLAVEEAGIVK